MLGLIDNTDDLRCTFFLHTVVKKNNPVLSNSFTSIAFYINRSQIPTESIRAFILHENGQLEQDDKFSYW